MHVGVVTLFPDMFAAISDFGISGRAVKNELLSLEYWNPRDFASDKHRTVDDRPFGGGPGMLMKTDTLVAAIRQARQQLATKLPEQSVRQVRTIYLSPQGRTMDQRKIAELAQLAGMVLVCGRYQGIDSRVIETEIDEEISLGDFVMSGGELAAMALIDAMVRLKPGALGDADSAHEDSFAAGLLHWPEYTRPQQFEGESVPEVLLSGDHEAIRKWRVKQSLGSTWLKRPDLLQGISLDKEQEQLLEEFKADHKANSSS